MKYEFISEHRHEHAIWLMCKVLEVSRSGYYAFRRHTAGEREQANARLLESIKVVHRDSHGTYGSPRVHQALRRKGISCGRNRVARLMADAGLVAKARRRYRTTTRQRQGVTAAPDLLKREFTAERPHQIWTGDITYIWTEEGWLYLAVILDLFSRVIVGWATSDRIDSSLVCAALDRALYRFRPAWDLIAHSDRGSQYTSRLYRAMLERQPVPLLQSNGLSCFDNAVTESFFHTLKTELVSFEHYRSRGEAHQSLFEYIEIFYNNRRLHSSIGYQTPMEKLEKSIRQAA